MSVQRQFERLYSTARMRLPGVVQDAMRAELYEVFLDFFERSRAWRDTLEVTFRTGEARSDVTPYAGRLIDLIELREDGTPVYATMAEAGTIEIRYPVRRKTAYTAEVSLNISDPLSREGDPVIPYVLLERYHAAFLDGLLARMYSQPGKPYTNAPMADYHMRKFIGAASRARNEVARRNITDGQAWRFPKGFV